jgi:hypothetical protein
MKKILIKFSAGLMLAIAATGCSKDYLEQEPTNAISVDNFFTSMTAVESAVDGLYKGLFAFGAGNTTGHDDFGQKSIDLANDLMGADMVVNSQGYGWFNRDYQYTEWQVATAGRRSSQAWFFYYNLNKNINLILAGVDNVPGASQTDKDKVKGQLYGMRAYAYYNLINNFQQTYKGNETKPGVPLLTSTLIPTAAPRGTVKDVYDLIIADLTKAEQLLTGKTFSSKVAFNVNVAQGFRARVALLQEDWATAATYANKARQGFTPMSATVYPTRSAFSNITNPEWIWGSYITADLATVYASFFSHMDVGLTSYAQLGGQKKITKALYDQIPTGDVRKTVFQATSGSTTNPQYNQLKHRLPSVSSWAADYLYMRAAEMYLIEAEALARQGQDAQAKTVLTSLISTRYAPYDVSSLSNTGLINEILLQRRIELWGEGFSLIDIKRLKTGLNRPTGTGNHGTPNFDPVTYTVADGSGRFLMRIPQAELDVNPGMTAADQNPTN